MFSFLFAQPSRRKARRLPLLGVLGFMVFAAVACGADATVAESAASASNPTNEAEAATGTSSEATNETETAPDTTTSETEAAAPEVATDDVATSAGAVSSNSDVEWLGPDWLDLPAGFTPTWAYEMKENLDGLVQGDLAADVVAADAVAHVRTAMANNGFSFVRDTPEWIVGVDANGEFVQVGVGSATPPVMNITFFTAESAASMGFTTVIDTLLVTLDGETFEIEGRCSERGEGFSGLTGDSFVSISGDASDWGVFMTITDPAGVEWSSLGGDITAISAAGFTMDTALINDAGDFLPTSLAATCG